MVLPPLLPLELLPPLALLLLLLLLLPHAASANTAPDSRTPVIALPRKRMLLLLIDAPGSRKYGNLVLSAD